MYKLILSVFTLLSIAASAHEMPAPAKSNKDFDQLKQLVGKWKGTMKGDDGKDQPATVNYELTSGGTAVMERLAPGSPMEMVTMYYLDGKSVAMTHYCAIGNQPRMKLKSADPKTMAFEMVGTDGVSSLKEMHMHALKLKWDGPNKFTQEWTNYMNGKTGEVAVFNFTRQ
jgi:hypothetical protein